MNSVSICIELCFFRILRLSILRAEAKLLETWCFGIEFGLLFLTGVLARMAGSLGVSFSLDLVILRYLRLEGAWFKYCKVGE